MDKNVKTVLVTGSSGLVGSEAVKFFEKKNWRVIGIDNDTRSKLFGTPEKNPANNIDIRDEFTINEIFSGVKIDAVIHTAAQPSHDWSQKEPITDFTINAFGTLVLLEAVRKYCPEAIFIHVSTDKVYGENMTADDLVEKKTRYHSDKPFNEELSIDNTLRSPFGCSKTAADIYVQEYARYFGLKTACFRCGCITGRNHEGSRAHGFLANVARCLKEGDTFHIDGYKGKQVRDNIHAHDLVSAFWEVIQKPKKGAVYNMGGGEDRSVSILEVIEMMEKETGLKMNTEYHEEPRKGDRIWDIHDVSKFKKDYPKWDYKYSLKDIIKDLCHES